MFTIAAPLASMTQSAQSYELARQTSGLPLSSPDVASLERVPVVLPVVVDAQPAEDFPATASPRAPPLG